jgi:putative Holliday junction resolvase
MRILGVDFGGTRTGLALSDPLGITCSPFATVEEKDEGRLIAKILATAVEEAVGAIVVGLPRPLKGGTNAQSEAAVAFKDRLEEKAPVPVRMWDERFTSRLADATRSRKGTSGPRGGGRGSSSGSQDAIAACYMLQNYLDARAQSTEDS